MATPSGKRLLIAVRAVEVEQKRLQEPAPIPHHPTAEKTVVTSEQPERHLSVTNKNAVRGNAYLCTFKTLPLLNGLMF